MAGEIAVSRVSIRVQPRASANQVYGLDHAGVLRVRVTAAPVDGMANEAALTVLAKALGVARGRVAIVRGAKARTKLIEVDGLSEQELEARLRAIVKPE